MSLIEIDHLPYRRAVSEEIRALMARRQISGVKLAEAVGMSYPTFMRRIHGKAAFDLDELEAIAAVLDCTVGDLVIQRYPVEELALAS